MKELSQDDHDNLIIDELLFFLQEKRTALAMIRIGIAAVMAQIAILGFLIAASKFYRWMEVVHLLIPFTILNIVILGLAGHLIVSSLIQIYQLDRRVLKYKKAHNKIGDLID